MRCINKSHPEFKKLAKQYGEVGAEAAIRQFTNEVSRSGEFIYPTKAELNEFFRNRKTSQLIILDVALSYDPNISKTQILNILQGIITDKNDKYKTVHVVKGRDHQINPSTYLINKSFIEKIAEKHPLIFRLHTEVNNNLSLDIREGEYNTLFNIDNFKDYNIHDASLQDIIENTRTKTVNNVERAAMLTVMLNKLQQMYNIKWRFDYRTSKKGYIFSGVVHINPNLASDDTPIHEFFHPFLEAIKVNPTLYTILNNQAKKIRTKSGELIADKVKALYPDYDDIKLNDEIITTAVGLAATGDVIEDKVSLSFLDNIKLFLQRLFLILLNNPNNIPNDLLNYPITSVAKAFIDPTAELDLSKYKISADSRTSLDDIVSSLKKTNNEIEVVYINDINETGEVEDGNGRSRIYQGLDGNVYRGVHEAFVNPFYKKLFPNEIDPTPRMEFLKNVGIVFHNFSDYILKDLVINIDGKDVKLLTDNGKLNQVYLDNPKKFEEEFINAVNKMNSYAVHPDYKDLPEKERIVLLDPDSFKELMLTSAGLVMNVVDTYHKRYGNNVRFLAEQRLIDGKELIAGTTDLLILSDDKFSVIDWKTVGATRLDLYKGNVEKEFLPMFKEAAYKIQLKQYVKMVHGMTGLAFDEAMAIPIGLHVDTYQDEDGNFIKGEFVLNEASYQRLGDKNIRKTNEGGEARYLLPILIQSDSTKQDHIHELIKKLEFLLDAYVSKNSKGDIEVKKDLKEIKYFEIRKIIQDLTILRNASGMVNRINNLITLSEKEISVPESELNLDKIQDIISELSIYRNISQYFPLEEANTTAAQIAVAESKVHLTLEKLIAARNNIFISDAKNRGIDNLTANEKGYSTIKRLFRETSAISDVKTISFMWAIKESLVNKANREKRDYLKRFKEFMDLTQEDFNYFFKKDDKGNLTPKLITQYDKNKLLSLANSTTDEFERAELETYFIKNVEKYEQSKQAYFDHVDTQLPLIPEPEGKNDLDLAFRIIEQNEKTIKRRDELKSQWEQRWNTPIVYRDDKATNINWRFFSFIDQATKFETEAYTKLKQSPKRLALYKLIKEVNLEAFSSGLITNPNSFYPSIIASAKEKMFVEGDIAQFIKNPFSSKALEEGVEDEETSAKVEIDPLTGEQVLTIKKLYQDKLSKTREDGTEDYSDYSFNLIKNYVMFMNHMKNYEVKLELEEKTNYLLEIEKAKNNLVVKPDGKIQLKANDVGILVPEEQIGVNENYKLLKQLRDFYVYGRTGFSDVGWKIGKWSAVKMLRKTMAWRSMTTLGLNFLSASSAFFGGFSNILLEANRNGFFTKKDILRAISTQGKIMFKDKDALKALAVLNEIDPLIDDLSNEREKRFSISKIDAHLTEDKLYILLRSVDKTIQFTVGYAVLNNHAVINGELVNIKDHIKTEIDFKNRFEQLAAQKKWSEIKALEQELEEKEEEFKKNNSILSNPEELSPEHIDRLRSLTRKLSSKVIGNASQEDVTGVKLTQLGSIAMQFKSWIPRLATERFGGPEMDNVTKSLNWGKYMAATSLLTKHGLAMARSVLGELNDLSFEKIQQKYEEMLKEHILNGGTHENFISLADFKNLYISNIRSTLKELTIVMALLTLIFTLQSMWDDDDEALNGYQRFALNALNKFNNELTFFWNPRSFSDLFNKPFPVVQSLTDVTSFLQHASKETFNQAQGLITGDEEKDLRSAKPSKYFFKLFPISKELINWMAIIDEDFRKEWGIRLNYR